jgi:hypothetical protein
LVILFTFFVTASCLVPPVNTAVAFPYVEPACAYCPGRRTIDFEQSVGGSVVSPVAGRITFAGKVVDQQFVTIDPTPSTGFDPAVVLTIGGLVIDPDVRSGQIVKSGGQIGVSNGLIHLSMRYISEGKPARYVDPTPYVGRRRTRARLIPHSRRGGRPVAQQLSCPASFGR